MSNALHPRHGLHRPTRGTPPRTPGSLRRTATLDLLRPEGVDGPLVVLGRARDLITLGDSATGRSSESSCRAVIDFHHGWELTDVSTEPARSELARLVGARVSSGFRRRLNEVAPDLIAADNRLHLLLDDFPGVTLISGLAHRLHSHDLGLPSPVPAARPDLVPDICAGFVSGGTIMTEIAVSGAPPLVTGPLAPPLATDDPNGWHRMDPLPPHAMRRARRIDVHPGPPCTADVLFRDSYLRADGEETVIHEYRISLEIDTEHVIRRCEATPQVLPWLECPVAARSAARIEGTPLADLRPHVSKELRGAATCTHLNDALRGCADIPALLRFAP
ncbi:DUF2889 domain-containing protein [Rhodococcus sp. NPDC057014]|uniref:DUF2889 domain-containing protein n=1 Tax=Rhodococcus sp. NPDC057014 TaxID=3346000 RepID=UPI003645D766